MRKQKRNCRHYFQDHCCNHNDEENVTNDIENTLRQIQIQLQKQYQVQLQMQQQLQEQAQKQYQDQDQDQRQFDYDYHKFEKVGNSVSKFNPKVVVKNEANSLSIIALLSAFGFFNKETGSTPMTINEVKELIEAVNPKVEEE